MKKTTMEKKVKSLSTYLKTNCNRFCGNEATTEVKRLGTLATVQVCEPCKNILIQYEYQEV